MDGMFFVRYHWQFIFVVTKLVTTFSWPLPLLPLYTSWHIQGIKQRQSAHPMVTVTKHSFCQSWLWENPSVYLVPLCRCPEHQSIRYVGCHYLVRGHSAVLEPQLNCDGDGFKLNDCNLTPFWGGAGGGALLRVHNSRPLAIKILYGHYIRVPTNNQRGPAQL